jgi:tRNA U54 and U55 pseudouridine synthase Pus10
MTCENCGRIATQIREEYQLCDRCYTKRFSTITINGKNMKAPAALKLQLEKMGLGRKEGESMADWCGRCRVWATNSRYWKKEMEGKA